MQLEFYVPSTNKVDALELDDIWGSVTDFETDGVKELTDAIVSALEAEGGAELMGVVVDDCTAFVPAGALKERSEEVARLYVFLDGLEDWQDTDKGMVLDGITLLSKKGGRSGDWRNTRAR